MRLVYRPTASLSPSVGAFHCMAFSEGSCYWRGWQNIDRTLYLTRFSWFFAILKALPSNSSVERESTLNKLAVCRGSEINAYFLKNPGNSSSSFHFNNPYKNSCSHIEQIKEVIPEKEHSLTKIHLLFNSFQVKMVYHSSHSLPVFIFSDGHNIWHSVETHKNIYCLNKRMNKYL